MSLKKKPRPRKSIIKDAVHPWDFMNLNMIYCCEQCTHFNPHSKSCSLGYNAENHLKETQLQHYARSGRMAFCRFLEID